MSLLENSKIKRKKFSPKSTSCLGKLFEWFEWVADSERKIVQKCYCGKFNGGDCPSVSYVNIRTGFGLRRDIKTMFKCGEFQKNLEALRKLKINQGTDSEV